MSNCAKVCGNGNLLNAVFSFVELAKENGTVAQVCKLWLNQAKEQYTRTQSLDLNWVNNRYQNLARFGNVVLRLLDPTVCPNLRAVKVPVALRVTEDGSQTYNLPLIRYMSVLQKLPAQIQMLDLDPSYPHRFHDLLPPNYEGEPLLTQKPAVTKLVTTGELVDWSIDEIVRKFPGLQDLQVSGPMDLEHLVRKCASLKALTSLVIFKNSTTSFIRPSSKEESLAQVPESPSVKRVSFTHPGFLNMKVVMLVVCKFPKLESLEFRNCTLAGTDFDRAVFHWTQDSYVELAIFNKEEIASMRDKFKQVPNCFNDECWNQLAELFAPAKQGQQAVAALDAPAAEKQQEGKKE